MNRLQLEKFIVWILPVTLIVIASVVYIEANDRFNFWSRDALRGLGVWTLVVLLVGGIAHLFIPKKTVPGFGILIGIFIFLSAGLSTGIAAILFLASVLLAGWLLLSLLDLHSHSPRIYELLIAGIIIYLVIFGVMIHFEINYRFIYILIILLPFGTFGIPSLRHTLLELIKAKYSIYVTTFLSVRYWHFLVFVWIAGFVATYTFLPVVMSDDNNYHLAMWTQLTFHHQYLFDVNTLIWSVSPFSVDLIHSIISLVAGANARPSINLIFYFLVLAGMWTMLGVFHLASANRLLVLGLFASTPMLANLLLSLQTDLFLAVLAVGGGVILFDSLRPVTNKALFTLLIGCLLVATKLPAAILAVGLFVTLVWTNCIFNKRFPLRALLGWRALTLFGLGGFVALHSYVVAFIVTKNPVFPLYNAIFKSPFYPEENFKDGLYTKGASFDAYWGLFFDSQSYFESPADFVGGFQYLFLLPLAIILLFLKKDARKWLVLCIPILLYAGLMFYMMQYLRYMFAILPLASVLIGYLLAASHHKVLLSGVFFLYTLINLWFMPGVSWNFFLNNMNNYSVEKQNEILVRSNPEILMNEYVNNKYGVKNVLFDMSRSNGATLAGTPFYLSWCAPLHLRSAIQWQTDQDVLSFFKANNIELIYWYKPLAQHDDSIRKIIKTVLDKYAFVEKEVGDLVLYRVVLH